VRKQRFRVRVGDREHDVIVELDPADDGIATVEVDGQRGEVLSEGSTAMVVRSSGEHAQTAVTLDPNDPPTQAVVQGRLVPVRVRTAQEAALTEALGASGRGGNSGASIRAPMPGRVVRVLVKPGDELDVGTPAVIVEAMKMENELHADTAGTVASVGVAEGDTVDAGQVLCEIVSHPAS
jgi:biotin carboxyl carrier protein